MRKPILLLAVGLLGIVPACATQNLWAEKFVEWYPGVGPSQSRAALKAFHVSSQIVQTPFALAFDIVLFPVQVIRGDRPYGPYADEPTGVRGYLTGSGFRDYLAGGQSKDEAAKE